MDDVKLLTTLKILIIGESNVGKSRYEQNQISILSNCILYLAFVLFQLTLINDDLLAINFYCVTVYYYDSRMTNSIQSSP